VGNAIKVLGARNVTFRDVRTEWTGPPKASNGAYGLYPVQCQNVLLENCRSYGASDAGLYVGQCHGVVVRGCRAERNVAGIEIENTVGADVYENVATNNTGGILVFDLPGLQVKAGRDVRVYQNKITLNNHVNFADPGSIVASVPSGTGVMIMATDSVEVFENEIKGNETGSILILSYLAVEKRISDKSYDPIPELISIHDNKITEGGQNPMGTLAKMLSRFFGKSLPDILWDGAVVPDSKVDSLSVVDNGEATYVNFKLADLDLKNVVAGGYSYDDDLSNVSAKIPRLPAVKLRPHSPPGSSKNSAVRVYRSLPDQLSGYGLFKGDLKLQQPAEGVFWYDLNTQLFTDYAEKRRFIKMPSGKKAKATGGGVLNFPVGTVIAKTFSYPHDMTDLKKGERLIETRIELRRESGWYGASYLWNKEQTDAKLALGGSEMEVNWKHFDGEMRKVRYQVPNANQCISCHSQNSRFVPIGPTLRNMNRKAPGSEINQLELMTNGNLLEGVPGHENLESFPVFDDESSGSLSERARAWLDVNCAHCHRPTGSARTTGLDLRWDQKDLTKAGVWKSPVAAGQAAGGRKFDIVPGKPDESILVFRIESDQLGIAMPSSGRRLVHTEGVELIREWIESLPKEE
jgi:parallel beta-helix repeat protein